MWERKQKLEGELRRLAATAAETGPSPFLVEAVHELEQQLREITEQLLTQEDDSLESHLADIRNFITEKMTNRLLCWLRSETYPEGNAQPRFGDPHDAAHRER